MLSGKSLSDEDLKYVYENYDKQDQAIEAEAFLAEFNLTDGQIINCLLYTSDAADE